MSLPCTRKPKHDPGMSTRRTSCISRGYAQKARGAFTRETHASQTVCLPKHRMAHSHLTSSMSSFTHWHRSRTLLLLPSMTTATMSFVWMCAWASANKRARRGVAICAQGTQFHAPPMRNSSGKSPCSLAKCYTSKNHNRCDTDSPYQAKSSAGISDSHFVACPQPESTQCSTLDLCKARLLGVCHLATCGPCCLGMLAPLQGRKRAKD